jgi:hypothetical protein
MSTPKETIATGSFKEGDLSLIAIAVGVCVPATSSVGWHHRLISVGVTRIVTAAC